MILAFSFNECIFLDLVKRGVLILVGEIWHYRNGYYYYYYYNFN